MHKKVKLVIVINDFLVGGAQRLTADLVSHFDRDQFDIVLVTLFQFNGRDTMYHLLPDNAKVYRLSFRSFTDARQWIRLAQILWYEQPDVVLSHLFFSNTVTRVLSPLLRYRVITVEHNTYVGKTKLQIACDRLLSLWTERIVAVSPRVRDFTVQQERIDRSKFVVIKNGVDIESIMRAVSVQTSLSVEDELGIPPDRKLVITVGRLAPQKNYPLLIQAFTQFCTKHSEYDLLIVGDGNSKEAVLKEVAASPMSKHMHLIGNTSSIYRYYAASEFFVSTAFIEGLSLAHLEALACGLPLVVTKTAGSEEVLQEEGNGFFIADHTPEAVNRALEKMHQADRSVFTVCARETAKQYDTKLMVELYAQLIIGVACA